MLISEAGPVTPPQNRVWRDVLNQKIRGQPNRRRLRGRLITDYGYLRIIADQQQLRIEYHPSSNGEVSKTPDDSVTVDLATRKIVTYNVPEAT